MKNTGNQKNKYPIILKKMEYSGKSKKPEISCP